MSYNILSIKHPYDLKERKRSGRESCFLQKNTANEQKKKEKPLVCNHQCKNDLGSVPQWVFVGEWYIYLES